MMWAALLIAAGSLWWHSEHHVAGLLAIAGIVWSSRRPTPLRLRKILLYIGILPFALWWLMAPSGSEREGFVPMLLFYIPGWYFIFLGLMQAATIDRGGKKVFAQWNAGAALLMSGMRASPVFYVAAFAFAIILFYEFRKDRVPSRWPIWSLLSACALAALLWLGVSSIRLQVQGDSDFMRSRQMRGFSPVSFLGSFADEYGSDLERQVVIRVFAKDAPDYLRGAVYSDYKHGYWRLDDQAKYRYPDAQRVEFGVFGKVGATPGAWIYPSVNTFGFLLVPQGTGAVAVQADSLGVTAGGALLAVQSAIDRGWFAWPGEPLEDALPMAHWLVVPERMRLLLDNALAQSGVASTSSVPETLMKLISWFSRDFRYSTKPPAPGKAEPLEIFMHSRIGYCEYFASLATLMLRAHGVPARYVTGFSGPDRGGDGVWLFRRVDAHAWVEYYDRGSWHTYDPTPPGAFPPGHERSWMSALQEWLGAKIALGMHILRDGDWKLVLDRMQLRFSDIFASSFLYVFSGLSALAFAVYRYARRRKCRIDASDERGKEWSQKLLKAEQRLARRGLVREPGETVGAFLERLDQYAQSGEAKLLRRYQAERFRPFPDKAAGAAIANSDLKPPGTSPII